MIDFIRPGTEPFTAHRTRSVSGEAVHSRKLSSKSDEERAGSGGVAILIRSSVQSFFFDRRWMRWS